MKPTTTSGKTHSDARKEAVSESPLTKDELGSLPRVPFVATMRRRLRLTQHEFASRFAIPLGTLRDWEQGRSEPDATSRAYLKVIAADPDRVAQVVGQDAA